MGIFGPKDRGTGHGSIFYAHYEQAFFIRQLMATALPILCILMRKRIPSLVPVFYLTIAITALNGFYYWLTVAGRFRPAFKWLQIGVDMLLWTMLVHFTGRENSVFFFFYPMEILVGAFTLSISGCFYGATLSSLFYTGDLLLFGGPSHLDGLLVVKLSFLFATCLISILLIKKLENKRLEVERLSEKLKQRAESAEGRFQVVLDHMSSGMVVLNEKGEIVMLNDAGAEICGIDKEGVIDKGLVELPSSCRELVEVLMKSAVANENLANIEFDYWREDGTLRQLLLNATHFDHWGKTWVLGIFSDQTELKQLRDRMAREEAFTTLGETVAAVAHEVRNSMTCIGGLLSLLQEDLRGEGKAFGLTETVVKAVDDLNKFVSDLLTYSRKTKPNLKVVDVHDVLESTLLQVVGKYDNGAIELQKNYHTGPLEVKADPDHLRCVFSNLLLNSLQAVHDEGSIAIATALKGSDVQVSVTDDGPGMASEICDKIFTPFFTTKSSGVGLGLPIAHKLVKAQGGTITVTSKPGFGTTFTVILPAIHRTTA